jgi:hypothetical protein
MWWLMINGSTASSQFSLLSTLAVNVSYQKLTHKLTSTISKTLFSTFEQAYLTPTIDGNFFYNYVWRVCLSN